VTDTDGVPLEEPFVVDLREHASEDGTSPVRKVLLKPSYTSL